MAHAADGGRGLLRRAMEAVDTVVFGHDSLKESALICLIAGGHLIIESAPGEGKTLFIKAFAKTLGLRSKRIQFRPDLLPSHIVGYMDRDPVNDSPYFVPGPIFAHVVLADEINAAPGKVQNTLLEAMQEGQVTIPHHDTEQLPKPHLVLATLNPVETGQARYDLPRAELDRFFLKERLYYPDEETMCRIIVHDADAALESIQPVLNADTLLDVMREVKARWKEARPDYPLVRYISRLAHTLRRALADQEEGASSRAANKLWVAASAYAWFQGRDEPTLADIIYPTAHSETPIVFRVWRHRLIVDDEQRADQLIRDAIAATPPLREGG